MVDYNGLENRRTERCRGFESLSLRVKYSVKGVNKNFNLSVGSEVELSNNFGGRDGFYVIPTLALKWTLN